MRRHYRTALYILTIVLVGLIAYATSGDFNSRLGFIAFVWALAFAGGLGSRWILRRLEGNGL